jgi:hypothetical protein
MAFMSKNNEVETALIGAVPKKIMKENLDALLKVFTFIYLFQIDFLEFYILNN